MSRSFDFNAITQQTLETKLGDQIFHVTTPHERLIEQLSASMDDLTDPAGKSIEKVKASYRLTAELISCNLEGITVTADDLRDKYKVPPIALAAFVTGYMEFINDFHNAKN